MPKGIGLVEAALYAGIEIPVFCYEPRLGPPVGACRMCLCEVAPGPPKPQAACTLTAADGMVVKTAATSRDGAPRRRTRRSSSSSSTTRSTARSATRAASARSRTSPSATAPGNTRMTLREADVREADPDLADDRARPRALHPLLPLHALLGGRRRGRPAGRPRTAAPRSIIATFEDEPYRAPFSGNVIELCPVGALTSTQYRFEARPWEIQNVPSVCGLCPVGCNITATTREGKVKRILSRNHPEIDEGWLCDKGRFGFSHLYARRPREATRCAGSASAASRSSPGTTRSTRRRALLRSGPVLLALSGSETVEQAEALSRLVRQGLGSDAVVLPEQATPALDAFRAPLSSIRDAEPRRRDRRRPGRGAGAGRRALDQGRAAERCGDRHRRRAGTVPAAPGNAPQKRFDSSSQMRSAAPRARC